MLSFLIIAGFIAIVTIAVIIFVNTAPQMGKQPNGNDLARIKQSPNYKNGKFINLVETHLASAGDLFKVLPEVFFGSHKKPSSPLPVRFEDNSDRENDTVCAITWYGHSTLFLEIQGKRILIDPMLGNVSAPVIFGSRRFPYENPIPIGSLTNIDAVILSHDHYDHLDYQSIKTLKDKVHHFYTPLGVGSHLKRWGIPETRITELDWWDTTNFEGIELVACPARHFSGRSFSDGNATLWTGWVIKGEYQNLYFSGDSGYGDHFKEIGEKYGPFDLALIECGQYNLAWKDIHMLPEESVQAGLDAKGDLLMPIHWGAFKLAVHGWTEPIERFKAECLKNGISMIHPMIGERFKVGQDYPSEEWWKLVE